MSDAEPESEVLRLLRRMESKLDDTLRCVDDMNGGLKCSAGAFDSRLRRMEELCARINASQKCLGDQIDELRRSVAEYHATTIVGVSSPEPK